MSVHYRFKSALEYDTITFDGLHISVKDLKNAIIQQKRIGKSTDFDLTITNAQTQDVYEDENALIPKNASLLVARVPITVPKQKQWEGYGGNDTPPAKVDEGGPIGKAMDLASLDAPEDDKIKAMMSQSTQDYDPSNYIKIRGSNQVGPVPPSYRCYKCHQNGHWIKECPLGQGAEPVEIKKSTGIPQSFMIPVEGPQVPGAMMMSNGQYAVPALDLQAYNQKGPVPQPVQAPKPEIPEDLLCSICSDLLTDAVMIPCCGNSFCDECVRTVLLESEDHECPDCHEKDISPATLIPNRFLRKSVANFKNTTGYEKKVVFKPRPEIPKEEPPKKEFTPPPIADSTEKENLKEEEKTVISEADSTEHAKNDEFVKDIEIESKTEELEGPPGVSPKHSPIRHITSKVSSDRSDRDREYRPSKVQKRRRSDSPRSPRRPRHRRSPSYETRRSSERTATPTRDEPPGVGGNYPHPPGDGYRGQPPPGAPGTGLPPGGVPVDGPPNSGPPVAFPPGTQPPIGSFPPPNFRLPPPGTQPPPFMGPGPYPLPPRPIFDPTRPPMGNFGPGFGGRSRDFGGRRGGRDRTPPGLIDDPLAAFNRIIREKDEKRARQQRMARRSWSRSRSRSRSFSRSPPPLRRRSRSPRRRLSRSRSRSFSISRSRSRSYSKSPRGSPLPLRRSSPPLQARRGAPRFRSPIRSPPLRRRNDRERPEFERDYDRGNFRDKPRARRADSRERFFDDRDRDFDNRGLGGGGGQQRGRAPPVQQQQWGGQRDGYYPPPQDQQGQQHGYQNRYPPPPMQNIPLQRKYEDIGPPGVAQPPVPGLETELPPVNLYERKRQTPERKDNKDKKDKYNSPKPDDREKRDRLRRRDDRRSRSRSRSPEKWRNPSPKARDGTPERPRKRRVSTDSRDEKRKDKDRHRDHSDDDKKKSKDKKKHKEKKDDKKKKKDKKDKHHKSKDKKDKKEEFKQVIPKNTGISDEDSDSVRKKIEERKKLREGEEAKKQTEEKERKKRENEEEKVREAKRLIEERKKEERRLRFIEDEKKKREDLAKKEEAKKRAIEEARRLLEEEERLRLKTEPEVKITDDLYNEVIDENDAKTQILAISNLIEVPLQDEVEDPSKTPAPKEEKEVEDGEVTDELESLGVLKPTEEEDSGILELHSELDMKLDENDILAPVPEKSKWEVDEDGQVQTSPNDSKDLNDSKTKVSSEVLKRAENVIFARAINSIRPIEIKKISGERAKLYSDDKKESEEPRKSEIITVEKPRLSIKERLGKKVDDPDPKIVILDTHSDSPFNRRERRIEIESHRRQDRRHPRSDGRDASRDKHRGRTDRNSDKSKRNKKDDKEKADEKKRKRSKSRSESEDLKKKKKDKKNKKEKDKSKKHEEEEIKKDETEEQKLKSATEKRKTTLDEANFEPDYDLELHDDDATSEIERETKKDKSLKKSEESDEDSSSSDSSSSSSEEERKKKKRKKQKKKRKKETSSSESDSSSDSSDSERERKRKKHKKNKKKKKKSKHK